MTWFLFALGVVLVIWGLWGASPPVPPRMNTAEPDQEADGNEERQRAWEVLSKPVATTERESKVTRRRRFVRGLAAGSGAGLIIAAVVVANLASGGDEAAPGEPGSTIPPSAQQPGAQNPAVKPDPTPQPAPPTSEQREVTFIIYPGEVASEIAENLVAANIIRDSALFVDRLIGRGLESRLKAGEFALKTEMSIDEVIDILTA